MSDFGKPSSAARAAPGNRLGFLLYRVGHSIGREFEAILEPFGITPAHFGLLNALDAYGPMHQQQIVRLLGINRQTVANVANDLERAGYLTRERPAKDKRTFILHLTSAGRLFVAEVDSASVSIEQSVFDLFTQEETNTFYVLLLRLATSGRFGNLFDTEVPTHEDHPENSG